MRTCGPWDCGPETSRLPGCRESGSSSKAPIALCVRLWGQEGVVSGGGFDQSTDEEDGPVTWEALASPRPIPVLRRAGASSPTHGTLRAHVSSAGGHRTSARLEGGHREGNRSRG